MLGPFLFAWVDSDETTFDESHWRVDEEIVSFNVSHSEGDFASLELTIINPRVGLLAPGRKVWAWLAYDRAWTPEPPDQVSESETEISEARDVVPLFFGRLVGIPEDLQDEQVRLTFVARPLDFAEQKAAVAETKKVRPYWDAIWFSGESRDNPDNVLESRPELWHIDRVTHVVTTSNILIGEDGTINLGEADIFYDSMSVSYGQAPARRVEVHASVSWSQNASGKMDISNMFTNSGSLLETFTGQGLQQNWPKSGASLGGGWRVTEGSAERLDGVAEPVWGWTQWGRELRVDSLSTTVPSWFRGLTANPLDPTSKVSKVLWIPMWRLRPRLEIEYDVSRSKHEQLSFVLESDVQAILTDEGDSEILTVNLESSEISTGVDSGGALPIRDVRNRVYFSSSRGAQSIEYLIALARAKLLARARTVSVDIEIPFEMGIDLALSCRKSVVVTDYRLPGGLAGGKITSYFLSADGDSGVLACGMTIGCSIGKGNSVVAVAGDPVYVNEGYVNFGYQRYSSRFEMPIVGEVLYGSIEGLGPNDDGVDFLRITPRRVVKDVTITNGPGDQIAAAGTTADEPNEIFTRLNSVPTTISLELMPLNGGPFETVFALSVSKLMVPKTIDLEAAP